MSLVDLHLFDIDISVGANSRKYRISLYSSNKVEEAKWTTPLLPYFSEKYRVFFVSTMDNHNHISHPYRHLGSDHPYYIYTLLHEFGE